MIVKRAPYGSDTPYIGVEKHREAKGVHEGVGRQRQKGPSSTLQYLLVTYQKVMTKKVASILDGRRNGNDEGEGIERVIIHKFICS